MTNPAAESAVLLIAHGSRVPESNAEIETMALRLAARLPSDCAAAHAFLELASPSIPEAVDTLAGAGIRHILLIPYFLAAGKHVAEDIPAIIEAARTRHPDLEIRMTGHFGAEDSVPGILTAMVSGAGRR